MRQIWLVVPLIALLVVAGCGDKSSGTDDAPSTTPTDVDLVARQAGSAKLAVEAQNAFGLRLLRLNAGQNRNSNILISPLSIWQDTTMAQLGTGGAAKAGLRRALSIAPSDQDAQLGASTQALNAALQAQNGVTLSIANALWADHRFQLVAGFTRDCSTYFGADMATLDFDSPIAATTVNNWVSTQTHGKISALVQPGDLKGNSVCLTNAIYFHGTWENQFDPKQTGDAPFHLTDGTTKNVPFMNMTELEDVYLSGSSFEGVRLPYKNSTCALWALLPRQGKSPADVLVELNPSKLDTQRNATKVNLNLPRFKMECTAALSDDLKAMGAAPAFAPRADFRPMLNQWGSLTGIRHKALIEVDEQGTTAAAATDESMAAASNETAPDEVTLTFDHPFVIALMEQQSGAALMLGIVNEPEKLTQ